MPPLLFALIAVPLEARLELPSGYERVSAAPGSFGAFLRQLPTKPGRPDVFLFDGRKKQNQSAQFVVIDVDVGKRDLQQCADAVMRLFAEWQWKQGAKDDICFRFTSGDEVAFKDWSKGVRPKVRGNQVRFVKSARPQKGYRTFRKYLDKIFMYAGTASLEKDLEPATGPIQLGDVFIRGGFPGHAIVVVDVIQKSDRRMFALAQSYMPAQDIHVLRNPSAAGPWYMQKETGKLETPEWTFEWSDRRRFTSTACPRRK